MRSSEDERMRLWRARWRGYGGRTPHGRNMLDSTERKGSALRRVWLITAVLAASCQMAAADVTGRDTLFTTVCIDDGIIGYEWRDGAWTPGQFHFNKHTL